MSSVILSSATRYDISQHINILQDSALTAQYPIDDVKIDTSDIYNAIMWGDHTALISSIPPAWLTQQVDPCTLAVVAERNGSRKSALDTFATGLQGAALHDATRRVNLPSMKNAWVRPDARITGYHGPQCVIFSDEWTSRTDLPRLQGYEEISAILDQMAARMVAEKDWEAKSRKVNSFLGQFRSLNEAVKVWPEVKHFLPQGILDRLHNKDQKRSLADERKARAEAVLQKFDEDSRMELTATAIGAKLLTASTGE